MAPPVSPPEEGQNLGGPGDETVVKRMSRILVVDDDPDLRELYIELLSELGHAVVGAPDGVVALELALSMRPELVLTDWRMPRMDGVELAKELRRSERLRGACIILHSSEGRPESRHADVCMSKLSDPEALRALVGELLASTRAGKVA
jgi:CheY-like chemotaxis protein